MAWRSGRLAGLVRRLLRLFMALFLLALLWGGGLIWFAGTIPREAPTPGSPEAQRHTDAIVVLTGGSGRLDTGLELLAERRARKLFVSGVSEGVDVRELLRVSGLSPNELECCITLGYSADNTIGNAYETAGWMREQGFTSLRLVTANYHMRRSLLEFHIVAPDIEIVPHPVASPHVHLADWYLWPGTASLLINEYNKFLVAFLRYRLETLLEP